MELRYHTDREFVLNDQNRTDRIYAAKIAALRERLSCYLLEGHFLAQEGLCLDNSVIKATVFATLDGRKAIALWNDSETNQSFKIKLEDTMLNAWASVEASGEGIPDTIGAQEILILYNSK